MTPASIVKLITAIVAIEVASNFQLPKSFKLEMVSEDDVEGSGRNLHAGDRFHSSTRRVVPEFSLPQYHGGKTGTLWPAIFNLAAVSATNSGGICVSVSLGSPTVEERY